MSDLKGGSFVEPHPVVDIDMVRGLLRFVSYKDRKAVARDMSVDLPGADPGRQWSRPWRRLKSARMPPHDQSAAAGSQVQPDHSVRRSAEGPKGQYTTNPIEVVMPNSRR